MAHPSDLLELGKIIFSIVIVLLLLSWITVVLRMWVRLGITKSPGWDDATIVFTLCLFTCYCAFILVIILGTSPRERISVEAVIRSLVYIQLSEVFYILTTTFLKISLGLFFLRVLTKPWQRHIFHTILVISALYGVFYFFVTIFQCGSPSNLIDGLMGGKNCVPAWFLLSTGYFYGILNVVCDWTFTLIPIVILIDSDMDRRSKISVSVVMGFAAIGSISAILRMVYLKALLFRGDVSEDSIKATIWATAEPGTGIIAASGAILRPLFRQGASYVREKITEYGTNKSLPRANHSISESVIGLTSVATTKSTGPGLFLNKALPANPRDAWDERLSFEQAQMGVGRVVSIRATAADAARPVPPKKP